MVSKLLPASIPTEFQELNSQIEQWRTNRVQRGPMPEPLWTSAAALAKQHGVGRVARCLHVDYYSLKDRLEAGVQEPTSVLEPKPAFVEVPLSPGTTVAECAIELEHPRGPRMKIHLKGATMSDVAALSRSLWGMRS